MIFDDATQLAIDNLGWVDGGSLWTYSPEKRKETRIPVDDSSYLRVNQGRNGLFRVIHHEGSDPAISVRHFREPGMELAAIRFRDGAPVFQGDDELWDSVEKAAIVNTKMGQKLLTVDAPSKRVTELDLSWFTKESYDLAYQGLVDCITVADADVVVSVQRSSRLIVIDVNRNEMTGSIELAGRHGNPRMCIRSARDFLASDYDTVCRIDVTEKKVVRTARLQRSLFANQQQFIGDYYLRNNRSCAVARPFSGDVLLLNSEDFKVVGKTRVGKQPLSLCMISDSKVITRDWQTGDLAMGEFR